MTGTSGSSETDQFEPPTPSDPPAAPGTELSDVDAAIEAAGADAFVHVGNRFDDDLRYLTRFDGPDRDYAIVVAEGQAVLCAPALFDAQAREEFSERGEPSDEDESTPGRGLERSVRTRNVGDPAGVRAADVLEDLIESGDADADAAVDVLVPSRIPHDTVAYLQRAGYEISSTPAVSEARAVKSAAEVDCIRFVQRAAVAGMARAETVLAAAEADRDDDVLRWNGDPLTTERLRRQVNAELARHGVRDAGNSVIGAGATAADLHYTGVDAIRPGETVLLDLSPRGPHGYYGDVTRTFVVDGDGGWERRAYVAVESAREAALAEVEAGVPAATVHGEAAAELAAYGFDPNAGEGETGFTHGTGHGVGVSLHEAPSLSGSDELEASHVVTIEPGVYDPEQGGVRLEDLVLVTDDGYEILAEYPFGIVPSRA